VLLVFVGVYREVTESGLGPKQALQILPYVVPSLLPFTIPACLLLTVCVVYGRMAGDQEITAAKAAGINVLSLLWPSFLLGGALSICSLLLADQIIPWAVTNIQKTITQAMEEILLDMLRTRHQVVDKERGISITVMRVDGKKLITPTIHYAPRDQKPITLQAQEATLEFDLDQKRVILHLVRGHIDIPGERRIWVTEEHYPFPLPYDNKKPKPRHQSVGEIRDQLDETTTMMAEMCDERDMESIVALTLGTFERLSQHDLRQHDLVQIDSRNTLLKLQTEVHSRFALACSCFFFAFLGAPFAVLQARAQFLTSFFLCFMPILVVYYPIILLTMNLAKNGSAPAMALWGGNTVIFSVAMYFLRRVIRH